MSSYQNTQTMVDGVIRDIESFRDLIGAKDPAKSGAYGFVPGLDMTNEAKALEEQARKLREGVFQVLFTGGFSSGKSTLLNALMRKNVLRTGINPETAVITKIIFGAEEKVIVYKKAIDSVSGVQKSETLSVSEFFRKYRVDQDDPELFADVDYVQLQQPEEGIAGRLVQFVDSPGTQNSKADDKAARDFAQKASAVVFLINAVKPFELDEKEYIKDHYEDKHLKNLFFVITRIDCVNEGEIPDLESNVKKQLSKVFTTDTGSFDEKLFKNRVFYVNGYGSMTARCGIQTKHPVQDEETGVPEFEDALGQYLTDSDRDKDSIAAYLPKLSTFYFNAARRVEEQEKQYEGGIEKVQNAKNELEDNISRINAIISNIETACQTAAERVIQGTKEAYDDFVSSVDNEWEEHFTANCPKFGVTDVISVAISKDEEKKRLKLKPITDAVQNYTKGKLDTVLAPRLSSVYTDTINKLQNQLTSYQEQLSSLGANVGVEDILKKVYSSAMGVDTSGLGFKPNMFQLFLGLVGSDLDVMAGAMSGQSTNMEMVKKFVLNTALEFVALYVVAWPIGIAMLIGRFVMMVKSIGKTGSTTAINLINGMRADTVKALKEGKTQVVMDSETNIGGAIIRAGVAIAESFKNELADKQTSLETTIANLSREGFDYEEEKVRTDSILKKLLELINDVSVRVTGRNMDLRRIEQLAEGSAEK